LDGGQQPLRERGKKRKKKAIYEMFKKTIGLRGSCGPLGSHKRQRIS
jgi:hypothetical protein